MIRTHKSAIIGAALFVMLAAMCLAGVSCASANSRTATWYGEPFHGRTTASGEVYDMTQMTAAHHSLPFGTLVRVTNKENGRSVVVRVNDRVPRRSKTAIDLSRGAFTQIAPLERGRVPVSVEVIGD